MIWPFLISRTYVVVFYCCCCRLLLTDLFLCGYEGESVRLRLRVEAARLGDAESRTSKSQLRERANYCTAFADFLQPSLRILITKIARI